MKTRLYFILALGLTLFACDSDDNNTVAEQKTQTLHPVIGNWVWVRSTGGIGGVQHTPESTGDEIILKISASTVKKYVNGELTQTRSYTLETHNSIQGGEKEMLIYDDLGSIKQSYDRDTNNLVMFDECFDCFQSDYVKE